MFGYTYVSYLLDPHKAQTQTRYVLTYGGTIISWRSVKQIMETCRLPFIKGNATKLYGDNVVCIAQIKGGFIKGDITKYIFPKFFHTHKLQEKGKINIQQNCSFSNLANLFTKVLHLTTFKKLRCNIGMRRLRDLLVEVLKKS